MQHLVPLMINYNTANAKSLAGNTINYPTEDTQPQVDIYTCTTNTDTQYRVCDLHTSPLCLESSTVVLMNKEYQ